MADLAALSEKIASEDYAGALAITAAILKSDPNDVEVRSCHVVCLMQTSKYEEAKAFIYSSKAEAQLWFELAYCHYRANELDQTIAILNRNDKNHLGRQQLLAQTHFRVGNYLEAAKIYEGLVGHEDIDPVELRTNLCACYSAAGEGPALDFLSRFEGKLDDSPDLIYNTSCALLESGDLEGALARLERAERVARVSLAEEGLTEEAIEDEVSIYQVQCAFIHQCLGRREVALTTYESVLKKKPSDAVVVAVASNNIIALKKDRDLFDSSKKAKAAISGDIEKKLTYRQKRAFALNRALLLLNMNQVDKCEELLAELEKTYPDSELPCIARASILQKSKQTERSTQMLEEYVKTHPGASHHVQLTLAQLLLNNNNIKEAIAVLENINREKPRLGITGTLVCLYEAISDVDGALQTLNSAVSEFDHKSKPDSKRKALLTQCAQLNLTHQRYRQAVEVLEKLYASDKSVLPLLVRAAAVVDPVKAERYAAQLPPLSIPAFDVDMLESKASVRSRPAASEQEAQPQEEETKKIKERRPMSEAKKKKLKLKRVLKHIPDYDPNYVPDPERWLPVYQRAASRKGRAGKKNFLKGSQGSTAGASEQQQHQQQQQLLHSAPPLIPTVSAPVAPMAARKKRR